MGCRTHIAEEQCGEFLLLLGNLAFAFGGPMLALAGTASTTSRAAAPFLITVRATPVTTRLAAAIAFTRFAFKLGKLPAMHRIGFLPYEFLHLWGLGVTSTGLSLMSTSLNR